MRTRPAPKPPNQVAARYGYLDIIDHGPAFISELLDAVLKMLVAKGAGLTAAAARAAPSLAPVDNAQPPSTGGAAADGVATAAYDDIGGTKDAGPLQQLSIESVNSIQKGEAEGIECEAAADAAAGIASDSAGSGTALAISDRPLSRRGQHSTAVMLRSPSSAPPAAPAEAPAPAPAGPAQWWGPPLVAEPSSGRPPPQAGTAALPQLVGQEEKEKTESAAVAVAVADAAVPVPVPAGPVARGGCGTDGLLVLPPPLPGGEAAAVRQGGQEAPQAAPQVAAAAARSLIEETVAAFLDARVYGK